MHLFLSGLSTVAHPSVLLAMAIGVVFGIIASTLPGLTAALAISLALPFVFNMNPTTGLALLGSIWAGAIYGASKSAILINTPGNPSALVTTFDGYKMTLKGKAPEALFGALLGSASGGIISAAVLLFLFSPLSHIGLLFGPAEYFWLGILGLTTISVVSKRGLVSGLLGVTVGLAISLIGVDPLSGAEGFTFGISHLASGISLVPALIGLFSFSQVLRLLGSKNKYIADYKESPGYMIRVLREYKQKLPLVLRSGLIGTGVGMLPGAGSAIATLVAYGESQRWEKEPRRIGTGVLAGIFTSEAAANATVGGSLIPLMALGIPGDADAAVVSGALLAYGLQPGPNMIARSGNIAFAFIASLFVSSILMLIIGFFIMRITGRVLLIPRRIIAPVILALATVGTYSINDSVFDVGVMFAIGAFAIIAQRCGLYPGSIALGVILAPLIHTSFTQTILLGNAKGNWHAFFGSWLSIVIVVLILLVGLSSARRKRASSSREREPSGDSKSAPERRSMRDLIFFSFVGAGFIVMLFDQPAVKPEYEAFARLVLGAGVLLSVIKVVSALRRPKLLPQPLAGDAGSSDPQLADGAAHQLVEASPRSDDVSDEEGYAVQPALIGVLASILYLILINIFGLYASTAVLVGVALLVTDGRRWGPRRILQSTAVGVVVAFVLFVIFTRTLGVPAPGGLLI